MSDEESAEYEAAEDAMLFSTCWLDLYARPRPQTESGKAQGKGKGVGGGKWKATAGLAATEGESFDAPAPTKGYRMDSVDLGTGPLPTAE